MCCQSCLGHGFQIPLKPSTTIQDLIGSENPTAKIAAVIIQTTSATKTVPQSLHVPCPAMLELSLPNLRHQFMYLFFRRMETMQFMLMFWPGFSMAVQSDQDAAQFAQCMLNDQSKRQMLQIQIHMFVKPARKS